MRTQTLESTLEKVSRIISRKYGMKVIFEGDSCNTDGDTIYLPSLPSEVPEELLGSIRGWCDHEVSHALYTETELGPEFQKKHGRRAFSVLNCLEDGRVERLLSEEYPGSAINLQEAFENISRKASDGEMQAGGFGHLTSALYTRATGRADQDWISPEAYSLCDGFAEDIRRARHANTTQEVAGAALSIWKKVKKNFPELPEVQETREEAEVQEETAKSGSESDSKEPGQEAEGSHENSPKQSQPPSLSQEGSPMDALPSLIESQVKQHLEGSLQEYTVYTTEYDVVEVPEMDEGYDYRKEMEELRPYVDALRRKLLQTLLGRQKIRWLRDRSRGKLDPRSLHRLACGRSGRIFRQPRIQEGGHTACTLLLDVSASMDGKALRLCRKLSLVFAEILSVLGFPTEIISFSTMDRDLRYELAQQTGASEEELAKKYTRLVPLYHGLFKQFGEPWRQAAKRFGALRSRALTPLGESLLFSAKRLAKRPEKRKVLFCLTDGKPVTGTWDESITLKHARESVIRISSAGIEPVGIGIQENCVEDLFPRSAVIYDMEQLPRKFLSELREVLSRRK